MLRIDGSSSQAAWAIKDMTDLGVQTQADWPVVLVDDENPCDAPVT